MEQIVNKFLNTSPHGFDNNIAEWWWLILVLVLMISFVVRYLKNRSLDKGAHPVDLAGKDTKAADDLSQEDFASSDAPDEKIDQVKFEMPDAGGIFERLKKGLSKTRKVLSTDIDHIFSDKKKIDETLMEELEELLITSDIGVKTSVSLIERISEKADQIAGSDQVKAILKKEILSCLDIDREDVEGRPDKPRVIMVVGVNGVGKTTTIGKLAAKFTHSGQKVLIAAADTFRAAAGEQIAIWAKRAGADIVKSREMTDPAAVAFDSIDAALARDIDTVIIDTAGRLHTKVNLMEELKKIKRTITKKLPGEPREILLVLDATTGQNAINQANLFNEALGVTGIALTKLDGTAKGGIVISVCSSQKIPLKHIGVGEKIEDLQDFEPKSFVEALL